MNSKLYGNTYKIPDEIIKRITAKMYSSSDNEGIKRAKNLVKNGYCTYQNLKRLKNFFDNSQSGTDQYELAGGNLMKQFVNQTLESERSRTGRHTELMRDIKPNLNDPNLKPQTGVVREGEEKKLKKNVLAIIFNDDMKVLVLKRSSYPDQWMPSKWALLGGGIEDDENPIDAIQREIKEETGLDVKKFNEKFVIQRSPDNVEHIFTAKYDGDNYEIKLNKEHDDYVWIDPNRVNELDSVPNLFDYIKLAIEKYE